MIDIINEVSRTSKTLILEEPFYGLFLVSLNKAYRKDIPTAGVSKHGINIQLAINPDFFATLNEHVKVGLIKHEILHVSFGHLTMRDSFPDKKLFNIAADLEINQYIPKQQTELTWIHPHTFPELNIPVKAGTKVYYDLLQQAKEDGTSPSLDSLLNDMSGGPSEHSTWDEFDDLSETDKKLITKQIEFQLKEVAEQTEKRRGTIPGEFGEIIARLRHVEPPKFDWRSYLRRFIGNSNILYTKKMRRKYNRRYTENPGLKIKFKNHILVGLDTSGSVSTNELKEFLNELHHMHKTGHMITIAQCDARLYPVEPYNPKKDFTVLGRGGTSFQPVIDHYNEKGYYTALIYFTDGECSAPENCPKNTLWCLSSTSTMTELPGKVIKLN
jgi:predicted metal-dependent peptidase